MYIERTDASQVRIMHLHRNTNEQFPKVIAIVLPQIVGDENVKQLCIKSVCDSSRALRLKGNYIFVWRRKLANAR